MEGECSTRDELEGLEVAMGACFSHIPLPETYRYTRIPAGAAVIRLLTLDPGVKEAPLSGQLQFVPLKGSHRYEALSYAWGDSNTPFDSYIVIDGTISHITISLQAALRGLRHKSSARVLWVDALCINQDDGIEKSHQITLMPVIYSNASCALCWLGEDSANMGSRAMTLLRKLQQAGPLPGKEPPDSWFATQGLPPFHSQRWQCLEYFFKLPWFRRRWIVQEFIEAAECYLICDGVSMSWREIEFGARRWMTCNFMGTGMEFNTDSLAFKNSLLTFAHQVSCFHGSSLFNILMDIKAENDLMGHSTRNMRELLDTDEAFMSLEQQRELGKIRALAASSGFTGLDWRTKSLSVLDLDHKMFQLIQTSTGISLPLKTKKLMPLCRLLSLFRYSQVSDPRDCIYALLGLAEERNELLFQPNYSMSVDTVYTRCARHLLENGDENQRLRVLLSAGLNRDREHHFQRTPWLAELPSWVPNWYTCSPRTPPSFLAQIVISQGFHNAAYSTKFRLRFGTDLNELCVMGSVADTAKKILDPPQFEDLTMSVSSVKGLRDYLGSIDECFSAWKKSPWSHKSAKNPDVQWRALIGNMQCIRDSNLSGQVPDSSYKDSYLKYRTLLGAVTEGLPPATRAELLRSCGNSFLSDSWPVDWSRTVCYYSFCLTENGFVGLVPTGTLVGDVVFVAYGCNMPLVLRKREGVGRRFQFIGGSYIHGIMAGEALHGPRWEEEEICLV